MLSKKYLEVNFSLHTLGNSAVPLLDTEEIKPINCKVEGER
jgi:hypothetical protein